MFMQLKSRQKLILSACAILLSAFVLLDVFVLTTSYSSSNAQARTIALLTSKDNAEKVVLNFENIETIGKSLAIQMETMVQENAQSREIIISTMKNTLNLHRDIFGVAVAYEPDAFDGRDRQFVNAEGCDSSGRFMPYITKNRDEKIGEAFASELSFYDYYTETQKLWYEVPKKTHKIYLTEPTNYIVQGKDITLVSVVVPIMRDGHFVGVVSIDTTIDYLQAEIEKVKPMGGFSQIISGKGVFVANGGNPKNILADLSKKREWIPILKRTSKGEEFTEIGYSADTGERVLRVFSSINIKGTNEFWTYASVIPLRAVLADFKDTFILTALVGFCLFACITYLVYSIIIKDI